MIMTKIRRWKISYRRRNEKVFIKDIDTEKGKEWMNSHHIVYFLAMSFNVFNHRPYLSHIPKLGRLHLPAWLKSIFIEYINWCYILVWPLLFFLWPASTPANNCMVKQQLIVRARDMSQPLWLMHIHSLFNWFLLAAQ